MIVEMRVYRTMPGKMPALLERFERSALPLFDRHAIRPLGFWTVLIGQSNLDLVYLLEWESMADREMRWTAFFTDPDWVKIRTESERDGALVESVSNSFLAPTRFSYRSAAKVPN